MLIPDEFLLLLKVFNDLPQRFLKNLNLAFKSFYFLLLLLASLVVLVNGP
jgi:hypothetical protein